MMCEIEILMKKNCFLHNYFTKNALEMVGPSNLFSWLLYAPWLLRDRNDKDWAKYEQRMKRKKVKQFRNEVLLQVIYTMLKMKT